MATKYNMLEAIDLVCSRGCAATTESYTRLILDCIRHKDARQAKRIQAHMDHHMYQPSTTFLHNRLLHLYVQSGLISDAQNLFDQMPRRDIFSYNLMLSAYSKQGHSRNMWDFFNLMPFHDSVSYNTMISGLRSGGCDDQALGVFVRMLRERVKPTEYTYTSVLNVCSQLLELRIGKVVHAKVVVSNLAGNVFVSNALIDFYAKCGEIDKTLWLFDKIRVRNMVSWNLMISGFLKNEQPQKCIDLFHEMKVSGLKPDKYTFSSVLGAFFQIGCIDEAYKMFRKIKEKDKVCWTTMIVGCGQNGLEEDALMFFAEMLSQNVRPDDITFSSVISSCAKLASLYHGQVVHGKAVHSGYDGDLLVCSSLIDMYSKCGQPTDAWIVFNTMPVKNVVSWNSMILGYAQNGRDLEAFGLYEEMLQENMKPSNTTFIGVLTACIHSGLSECGKKYFQSITELHGMKPSLDHYTCMITLVARFDSVDKALDLLKSMPYEPNCRIWSTLLAACKMKGDIENAERAARHLFELDPHNAEPYIILSNMYAACSRWEDVAKTRSLMKANQVKKFSAYSWMEIDGKVHTFEADDKTHPESEVIYAELHRLLKTLEEAGFILDKSLVLQKVEEDQKFLSICYHSEKLALAFALVRKPHGKAPIRIIKNVRVCSDCHLFMKFASNIIGRAIILRDSNRFHHFVGGLCSCKDYR